jgi:alanine dehydrogenase
MKTLLLTEKDVASLIEMGEVIEAVESAFKEKALGYAQMPPKPYLFYDNYNGDLRTMSSYCETLDISAVKVVNVHPDNPKKFMIPTIMAIIVLIDPKNGFPLSIMGGTLITAMRTGAAGGLAAKYLSRKESKVLTIIGAGVQAQTQLLATLKVRKIERVYVYDIQKKKAQKFANRMEKNFEIDITSVEEPEEAIVEADILTTITPSKIPIIKDEWINEGLHINAIGADAPGKEELDPAILKRSKIIIDDWEQASHSGEINIPFSNKIITKDDIWGEIGEVISGLKKGRQSSNEITIFDSTGLAVQDAATAWYVYNKARANEMGRLVSIL